MDELILEGVVCEKCMEYIGESTGHMRMCGDCEKPDEDIVYSDLCAVFNPVFS